MKASDILKNLIPFTPLIIIFAVIIIKPYYLFPNAGDTDFHLARAREILENPFIGLFWSNLTHYPQGGPILHQPLFHAVYAFVWGLGGVRFAHSFMCILQLLLTVGVATWIADKEYGTLAGYFAGIFALSCPLQYTLIIAIPATYIPIFAMLTIYYIPKDKKKAFITSLLGIWTHMVGLISFIPLFLVDNYKDKRNLKIIALLLPSLLFWAGYWIYFSGRGLAIDSSNSVNSLHVGTYLNFDGFYGFLMIYTLGIIGLYLLYRINTKQFKLIITYSLIVIGSGFLTYKGDFLRGFQLAALPMAILSGLTVQKGYEHVSKNYKPIFSSILILMFLFLSIIGAVIFFAQLPNQHGKGWDALSYPFEGNYTTLKHYIEGNTNKNDVVWAESELTEKVAWMTGRKVSNQNYQKINIYTLDNAFLIKGPNNQILEQIKINSSY